MKRILTVLLFLAIATAVQADTHNAATCEEGDIQTAIDAATAGDTVSVPAGSCTWTSQITMHKGIILSAASPTITINGCSGTTGCIYSNTTEARRITGFNFTQSASAIIMYMRGSGEFRIDHNEFSLCRTAIFVNSPVISGGSYLIDNNSFDAGITNAEVIQQLPSDSSTSWSSADTWGVDEGLYIEDNSFTKSTISGTIAGHAAMVQGGARVVFRYNSVRDMNFDAHGKCSNASGGARLWEVYNNTFTVSTGKTISRMIYIRGGTGVVLNNTITTEGTGAISSRAVDMEEFQVYYGRGLCSAIAPAGCCCTYPCSQQIGRGLDGTTETPVYIWDNTLNGGAITVGPMTTTGCQTECGSSQSTATYVQANRDYFLATKVGYSGYTYPHPLRGSIPTYTVTVTSSGSGTLSPNENRTVYANEVAQFEATPNTGYTASCSGTCTPTLNGTIVTTASVVADCTVSCSFNLSDLKAAISTGTNVTIGAGAGTITLAP